LYIVKNKASHLHRRLSGKTFQNDASYARLPCVENPKVSISARVTHRIVGFTVDQSLTAIKTAAVTG
jgi:hypothetical protein